MRLESIDFPSDPNCELVKGLREVLSKQLHRCAESTDVADKFEDVLKFTASKFKEAKKESYAIRTSRLKVSMVQPLED